MLNIYQYNTIFILLAKLHISFGRYIPGSVHSHTVMPFGSCFFTRDLKGRRRPSWRRPAFVALTSSLGRHTWQFALQWLEAVPSRSWIEQAFDSALLGLGSHVCVRKYASKWWWKVDRKSAVQGQYKTCWNAEKKWENFSSRRARAPNEIQHKSRGFVSELALRDLTGLWSLELSQSKSHDQFQANKHNVFQ